jgi:hypothetical protein
MDLAESEGDHLECDPILGRIGSDRYSRRFAQVVQLVGRSKRIDLDHYVSDGTIEGPLSECDLRRRYVPVADLLMVAISAEVFSRELRRYVSGMNMEWCEEPQAVNA